MNIPVLFRKNNANNINFRTYIYVPVDAGHVMSSCVIVVEDPVACQTFIVINFYRIGHFDGFSFRGTNIVYDDKYHVASSNWLDNVGSEKKK